MMVPFDLPILTRTLAVQLRLRHTHFEPFIISRDLSLQLEASLDRDSPNVVVDSYLYNWWTDPDTTSWSAISNETIEEALEHHRAQRRRSSQSPPQVIPGPATPETLHNVRNGAESYRTMFETRVQLSARRAAGFLMLSEAAVKKEDHHIIQLVGRKMPEYVDSTRPRPAQVRHSISMQVDRASVPSASRDLGIRLTPTEVVQVFASPGTDYYQRTCDVRVGDPPASNLDDISNETFSTISHDSGPSELGPDDIPTNFQQPPLLRVGSHLPPFVYRRYFAEQEQQGKDAEQNVPAAVSSAAAPAKSPAAVPAKSPSALQPDVQPMDVDSHATGIIVVLLISNSTNFFIQASVTLACCLRLYQTNFCVRSHRSRSTQCPMRQK